MPTVSDVVITPSQVVPPPEGSPASFRLQRLTAGENINAGQWVYQDPATGFAKLSFAGAPGDPNTADTSGIAVDSAITGQPVNFLGGDDRGTVELEVGPVLTQGRGYSLSSNPGGMVPTNFVLSTVGMQITYLGYATTSHTLKIFVRPTGLTVPWTPALIGSSLVLWLDAVDQTTRYQDSALTTLALATNNPVGGWKDKSASGLNATQTAATQRPTLINNIINGKPILRVDGVDDFLALSGYTFTGPFTLFWITTVTTGTTNILLANTSPASTVGFFGTIFYFINDAGANVPYSGAPPLGSRVYRFSRDGSNVCKLLWTGGTEQNLGTLGGNLSFNQILARPPINQWSSPYTQFGEIVLCNGALPDATISPYFQNKWNLTIP